MNRKNVLLIALSVTGVLAHAQTSLGKVGINTSSPNATLDITASPNDNNTADGLLAPRLTGNELKAKDSLYGTDQTGTLVYATAAVTTSSPKTANITAAGYYYFDGSVWQKVNTGAGNFWGLTGNSGTTGGSNFVGTTDAQNLVFKVNNIESGYIQRSVSSTGSFDYKTSFGYNTLSAVTTGDHNTAFGHGSGAVITTGSDNTLIGSESGKAITGDDTSTPSIKEAARNTAVGSRTLFSATTGYDNTAIGAYALASNTTGVRNLAVGSNALVDNTTGDNNVAVGDTSLNANTTGSQNTALGQRALASMTSGTGNTGIGAATVISNGLTNATAVGFQANATQSNSLILGNNADVGIGTSTPSNKLHVSASANPVRFEGLQTTAVTTGEELLLVNSSGVVKKVTLGSGLGISGGALIANPKSGVTALNSGASDQVVTQAAGFTQLTLNAEQADAISNFDPTTGIFTASYTGAHLITLPYRVTSGGNSISFELFNSTDSTSQGTITITNASNTNSNTYSTVVNLIAGKNYFIRVRANTAASVTIDRANTYFSMIQL
ncbi:MULTISPECIES: beta strand repeat-containing protein [unclassified Chryseobacterium]|uniref:beta strand repeat-containing protein n=1 Tax=unclassified Chryseobacterium TaxID=2593645 RepID=UPI000F4E066C|nr:MULTISPECIES: hypothetical protein [unclassified Chryseobacterium]